MLKGFAFIILSYIIYYTVIIIYDLFKKKNSDSKDDVAKVYSVEGLNEDIPPGEVQNFNLENTKIFESKNPNHNQSLVQNSNPETSTNNNTAESYQKEADIKEEEKLQREVSQHSSKSKELDKIAEETTKSKTRFTEFLSESINVSHEELSEQDSIFLSRDFASQDEMKNFINQADTSITVERVMDDGTLVFGSAY